MLLIDWTNNGSEPVGQVKAEMKFYDDQDHLLQDVPDYTVFEAENSFMSVKPGETRTTASGHGFVFMPAPPAYTKAARAEVAITSALGTR